MRRRVNRQRIMQEKRMALLERQRAERDKWWDNYRELCRETAAAAPTGPRPQPKPVLPPLFPTEQETASTERHPKQARTEEP